MISAAPNPSQRPAPDLTYRPTLWRNVANQLLSGLATLFCLAALSPLFLVLLFVFQKGSALLSLRLFLEIPPVAGDSGGGIGSAIAGTILLLLVASAIAIPVGVLAGTYLSEFSTNGRIAQIIRFGSAVLSGVPSIILGVFVYGLVVVTKVFLGATFSALAGGLALAVLMLPTIITTTDETLKLVPNELRLASLGLGASKMVTTFRVVLPAALSGIITGVSLAIARAAGETAPLLFTALFTSFWPDGLLQPVGSMAVLIYKFATAPYQAQNDLAWAASFILVILVLLANVAARLAVGRLKS